MRLRNDPEAHEKLKIFDNYIQNPFEYRGKWHAYFGNNNPIHMEIGSGKGKFIITLAQQNPQINYIAFEKVPTVLLKLVRKIPDGGLKNLAVISEDAKKLCEIFEDGEIDKIYLNFSDPWPKYRHTKRRLTAKPFLNIYERVLKDNSLIEFKTDNRPFFDFSLEELKDSKFIIERFTYDLYNSDLLEGNIATEYEERFHGLGTPINKVIVRLNKK
ncbi:MAG: tRNA (guanosine(46)-N7)-methyltransferase TrmB [Clostridiaceae bacterium]|nr:tRNA (guanosine(46)-N7)-methyltransferase TrmB [Clostridiaceae bacterium]